MNFTSLAHGQVHLLRIVSGCFCAAKEESVVVTDNMQPAQLAGPFLRMFSDPWSRKLISKTFGFYLAFHSSTQAFKTNPGKICLPLHFLI